MQSFALRSNLRNALYLAVPKQDCGEKFPAKSVTLNDLSESNIQRSTIPRDAGRSSAPHLGTCGESKANVCFGAFASFETRAERARQTLMDQTKELRELPFAEAAQKWLEQRRLYIRESTANCYRDYLTRLNEYFNGKERAGLLLKDIHIGHFQEYQGTMRKKYHAASVNHDLNILTQILKHAELWNESIQAHYRPLPLPEQDPLKVMSEAQEDAFFKFASTHKESWLAYFVASLTNNSTASGKELRMLQLSSIDLDAEPPYFRVPKNMKNPNRQRLIPLNERGAEMMRRILLKASERGSTRPEHYVFPFRIKRNLFDPNRPASESWLKAQWKMLVDAAIEAKVINFRIKPHNLRHQVITRLLDNGVPIETVRQIAGHGVDSVITRHYHHARVETLARALDVIDPDKKKPGFAPRVKGVTNAG